MLRYTLYALLKEGQLSEEELLASVLFADEFQVIRLLEQWWSSYAGPIYANYPLVSYLLLPRPKPYVMILELSSQGDRVPGSFIQSARDCGIAGLEEIRLRMLADMNHDFNLKVNDILFDIPQQRSLKLGEDIDVELSPDEIQSLSESSKVVGSLPSAFEISAVKFRVFCRPEKVTELKSKSKLSQLSQAIREYLFAELG
jgi:hypothetical protein